MGVCASSRKAKERPIAVDVEIIDDSDKDRRGVDDSERQEEVKPELEHETDKDTRTLIHTMLIDLSDDILTLIIDFATVASFLNLSACSRQFVSLTSDSYCLVQAVILLKTHYSPEKRIMMHDVGLRKWTYRCCINKAFAYKLWMNASSRLKGRLDAKLSDYTREDNKVISLTVNSVFEKLWNPEC